eukprot:jgi/Chlat1/8210/Chrsp76S07643
MASALSSVSVPAPSRTDNAESKNKIPLNDVKINDVEPVVEAVTEKSAKGGLSPAQVHSLLTTICQETEFMEANIKIGAFKMFVKRKSSAATAATEAVAALAAPSAPPVAAAPVPAPTSAPTQEDEDYQDEFGDEGLVPVTAGRVGVVRRGRVFKGKAGKPVVNVGDTVKKGQTICFIEQLGTHMPVESPLAGEVVNFPVEDADPVEFGQILVQLRPDFPGIKSRR